MLELERFLDYCDIQYQNSNPTKCGVECSNNNYCQGQEPHCYKCIKRVHNCYNNTIHYNCAKMLYNYVLKQSYRFSAEIYYLFQNIQKYIVQQGDLYVTSIGCGPCTELFGALFHWRSIGKLDTLFHYKGFDIEPMWNPIMQKLPAFFQGADVKLYDKDVFKYYQTTQDRVDILVLNYMISDMLKFKCNQYSAFLTSLCNFISQIKPKYLLINDVYLKVSIEASRLLFERLNTEGIMYQYLKLQYHGINPYIGQYGKIITRQPFNMPNKSIVNRYDPFSHVDSIQTIIRFK